PPKFNRGVRHIDGSDAIPGGEPSSEEHPRAQEIDTAGNAACVHMNGSKGVVSERRTGIPPHASKTVFYICTRLVHGQRSQVARGDDALSELLQLTRSQHPPQLGSAA